MADLPQRAIELRIDHELEVIRRPRPWAEFGEWSFPPFEPRSPTEHLEHDGEWHALVTLPHKIVEHEGYGVPAFEGDAERIEWERAHGRM